MQYWQQSSLWDGSSPWCQLPRDPHQVSWFLVSIFLIYNSTDFFFFSIPPHVEDAHMAAFNMNVSPNANMVSHWIIVDPEKSNHNKVISNNFQQSLIIADHCWLSVETANFIFYFFLTLFHVVPCLHEGCCHSFQLQEFPWKSNQP